MALERETVEIARADALTIGEVAERAGVNTETLRFYERKGILPEPPRSASNYRLYPGEAVRRVRFIKHAQEIGFSLREIGELLSLRAMPRARCGTVLKRAEEKVADIDEKIRRLKVVREALVRLKKECRGNAPISKCPILESLDAEEDE